MPELGNILLLLACLLSLTYLFLPLSSCRFITTAIFFCVSTSMAILIYCHITNDFSLENVYYHSHTTKPLIYKICGVWGNKEGSMLLWTLVLTMYLLLMDIYIPSVIPVLDYLDPDNLIANEYIKWQYNKNWIPVSSTGMTPERTNGSKLKKISLITQGLICFCFLLFTLLESSPFTKMPSVEKDGLGFNPILQDIGLAIHPPILYLGYLGFSVPFSLSIAGLIAKVEGNVWAKIVRPWVLISWSLLTLGISLGSWWAYRELGWGGFWFWDPVENVSLMPWLIAVALTHLLLVVRNFNVLRNFAILLTLTTFILSVTGTFLVRSGILTSVHTFADDPRYGLYILALLGVITVSSLVVFIAFAKKNRSLTPPPVIPVLGTGIQEKNIEGPNYTPKQNFSVFSRFTMMLMNNLLFITAFFIVFVGTLYPTVLEYLTGELISVGAPYYNSLFNPIALAILVLTMIGQYCSWQGNSLLPIFREYRFSFCSAAAILPFIFHMELIIVLSITISIALLIFVLEAYSKRIRLFKSESILLAKKVSKSYYAMMAAHAGVAILVLGIAYSVGWQEKKENYLKIGDSITVNKFKVTLRNIELIKEKNFHAVRGTMDIRNLLNNKILGEITPEYRFYLVEGQKNVESSIYHNLLSDIYVVIGEIDKSKSKIAAKVHYKPGMSIIWLGSFLIAFGSLLAAFPFSKRAKVV
ncbi:MULTISPECIES: heme lyase CcmF/NrfE family subunit [unclassified Wolbachia]|uniref:heme lyase CcmF/NrfE family subunit n=2 Tax=Wolbachieae TaxID=952 RepID=UPI00004CA5F9|nr:MULTISPECIES: heme lyase CcmF/NrfE family subunit [unclassified Wolbachia]ACN95052.1 Cytochrome c biogenesis factor [Wolbachia sp. wRi]EAL60062.1 CycK cytochrome c-type synthesis protein [Wolbachia endosymbiont of Drosophila simulans]MBA8766552.1 heme lyase CcmF/NrfE family subunit [Wolbachia pipientis]MDX5497755.1 heme lyase CcmF/NrfE family subunit [Wolbachia endosymbiont of Lasioglossum nitidulum]MDX5562052.1 heme lyase CcmF/NrfE family subunit [Wolbachia endosymbiont of Andrena bicolor]